MDVKEIMVHDVVTVQGDMTVIDAVNMMNEHHIGCLIVTSEREAEGILTERDILLRVVSKSKDPKDTRVSEVMSKPIIASGPTMYVEDAAKLMFKKNIKKLPIVENGQIIGIVTLSDIARTANMNQQIVNVIGELKQKGWLPSGRMKKVVDFYIA